MRLNALKPGPFLDARIVKTEIEAFLFLINEHMIEIIVERTNKQIQNVVKRLMLANFLLILVTQTRKKCSVYLNCYFFRDYINKRIMVWQFFARKIYISVIPLNRYDDNSFYDYSTLRADFLDDRLGKLKSFNRFATQV